MSNIYWYQTFEGKLSFGMLLLALALFALLIQSNMQSISQPYVGMPSASESQSQMHVNAQTQQHATEQEMPLMEPYKYNPADSAPAQSDSRMPQPQQPTTKHGKDNQPNILPEFDIL